ncbi:AAA family ATPase [Eggerthellaceae bacterium zg-887]|nr:AAA family ATPase [Xiamenia xianingshaonis]
MKRLVNPFKPTAGAEPPVLVGREKVIEDFSDGLAEGAGARGRLMRITGPRGSGKTVLLTELGDLARNEGWDVIDETARDGLCDRIAHAASSEASRADLSFDLHAGVFDFHAATPKPEGPCDLRDALTKRLQVLARQKRGLLITLDEVQDANRDEMREIAAAVQHLIREKHDIAFVFAGLTSGVLDLVNGEALTFLRRALPEELAAIPTEEVRAAYRETMVRSGLDIEDEALSIAAQATVGYAYLVQLVGYQVWRAGKGHVETSKLITALDARQGVDAAIDEFFDAVLESAVAGLPLRAVEYLLAMADGPDVCPTAFVADELNVAAASLTSYRRMLIQRQIIESHARGFVTFAIPYTRRFLRERKESLLARYGVQ